MSVRLVHASQVRAGSTGRSPAGTGWRTLVGANVLWLGFSMLFDGLNALILPERLAALVGGGAATALGLYSLLGIGLGMLVQPMVGAFSDRQVASWGRFRPLGILLIALIASLLFFAQAETLALVVIAYVAVQVAANAGQAIHQAVMPDVVSADRFGRAAGVKGAFDLLGAVLGFALLGWILEEHGVSLAMITIGLVLATGFVVARVLIGSSSGAGSTEPPVRASTSSGPLVRLVVSRFLFLAGTYAVGRFLLFFVAHRLGLPVAQATEEAGAVLGGLALLTAVAALPSGWASDRYGRIPVMWAGAAWSAIGALLLITAQDLGTIFLFGAAMAVGSASFGAANWAAAADLAPAGGSGRVLGLANLGTGGAAAAAGLFGPVIDAGNRGGDGAGYVVLLVGSAACFVASAVPLLRLRESAAGASFGASITSAHTDR